MSTTRAKCFLILLGLCLLLHALHSSSSSGSSLPNLPKTKLFDHLKNLYQACFYDLSLQHLIEDPQYQAERRKEEFTFELNYVENETPAKLFSVLLIANIFFSIFYFVVYMLTCGCCCCFYDRRQPSGFSYTFILVLLYAIVCILVIQENMNKAQLEEQQQAAGIGAGVQGIFNYWFPSREEQDKQDKHQKDQQELMNLVIAAAPIVIFISSILDNTTGKWTNRYFMMVFGIMSYAATVGLYNKYLVPCWRAYHNPLQYASQCAIDQEQAKSFIRLLKEYLNRL